MKRFLSTQYSPGAFNIAMLLLRIVAGGLLLKIGFEKLVGFEKLSGTFMNFMGLGSKVSLALVIFAEFFCSVLVIIGLLTRLACIPIIFTMCVIIFQVNHGNIEKSQSAILFLICFAVLLLVGAGRASADGMMSRK